MHEIEKLFLIICNLYLICRILFEKQIMNSIQLIILTASAIAFVIIILFLAWFFSNNARNKERLLFIEKGASPADLTIPESKWKNIPWKIIGFTALGLGFGLFLMEFSGPHTKFDETYYYYGYPILFGGLGMVLGNLSLKSKKSKDSNG